MYLRWIGLAFIFACLVMGAIMAAGVQIFQRVESYALEDQTPYPIMDRIVPVPPWNRTEESDLPYGWVGFNISLPNQGKVRHEAYGVILPNNTLEKPTVVMRIVNETGFADLIFDHFSDSAWRASKVYAAAHLNSTHLSHVFRFMDLDNASKYCVFFRGIDNGTKDFEILISIKEAWYEGQTLLQRTTANVTIVATTAIIGLGLTAISFRQPRKRYLRKRITRHSQKNATNLNRPKILRA